MGRTDCQSEQQGEGKTGGKLRKWLPYVSEFYLSQDLTARRVSEMPCTLGRVRQEERGYQMFQSASFSLFFVLLCFFFETDFISVAPAVLELAL